MVEEKVIVDLVDYMVKLDKEMNRRGMPAWLIVAILGQLVFHQFNGTRNDTERLFKQIIDQFKDKKEKESQ